MTDGYSARTVVALAAVITACSVGAAVASAASNTCVTTGVTAAEATKIFGTASSCHNDKGEGSGLIGTGIVESANTFEGATIQLYAESYLKTWLQGDTSSAAYVRPLKLGGLGSSAGLFNSPAYNYSTLYFTAGTYTVLISGAGALSTTPGSGVTKQQIEALAHVIYARLR
jgi:hypothetical protein